MPPAAVPATLIAIEKARAALPTAASMKRIVDQSLKRS